MKYIPRKLCIYCGNLVKKTTTITCSRKCANFYRWKTIKINYQDYIKNKILSNIDINDIGCWNWKKSKSKSGYANISYKGKKQRGNRISYEIFKGEILNNMLVCHTCDNPACVNPSHLYLGTHQNNAQDKLNRNRQPKGEKIKLAKLTEKSVNEIRQLAKEGMQSQLQIANLFGISQTTISRIVLRQTWKHI